MTYTSFGFGALLRDRQQVEPDGVRAIESVWVGDSRTLELVDVRAPHPDTPVEMLEQARVEIARDMILYGEVRR